MSTQNEKSFAEEVAEQLANSDVDSAIESKKKPATTNNKSKGGSRASTIRARDNNGKSFLRIPWVDRVKQPLLKLLWVMPVYCMYLMYVSYQAGELGINTIWCGVLAFAVHAGIAVAIKYTDVEDYWNARKGDD